jgi:hypothetical protein
LAIVFSRLNQHSKVARGFLPWRESIHEERGFLGHDCPADIPAGFAALNRFHLFDSSVFGD